MGDQAAAQFIASIGTGAGTATTFISNPSHLLRPRYFAATAQSSVRSKAMDVEIGSSFLALPAVTGGGHTEVGVTLGSPDLDGGLTPDSGSTALDRGNEFLDFDPLAPGIQRLPATDILGKPRKGNGTRVDVGAVERQ